MDFKYFLGNLLGVCSIPFTITGFVCLFQTLISVGLILVLIGVIFMLTAIYLRDKMLLEKTFKEKNFKNNEDEIDSNSNIIEMNEATDTAEAKVDNFPFIADAINNIKDEEYIDKKVKEIVEIFAILSDKRTNKETRARKLKQYFNEDTNLFDW